MVLLCLPFGSHADDSISGTLGAVGSDTMAELMLRWGEALNARHPGIRLQFKAGGSAEAPTALLAGTTRLGPMSRRMTAEEHDAFVARYGYPPLALKVAQDALTVVVHRHAPLDRLTLEQIDALFSTTRRCGADTALTRWEQLPLKHPWPYGKVALHGRNLASGTHGLFRQEGLCEGRFRADISEHPGSSAVVAAVGESPGAMGYTGYNHLTPAVRALAVEDAAGRAIPPTPQTIQSGAYPLTRFLYLYVNLPPDESLPAVENALLELILSPQGQRIAQAAGFVPLTDAMRDTQRLPELLSPE
ncbi:phosphate ABC transporter substrate-binding protein [Halomonas sp. Bachu 37]|uniref:PstS family phosphate ABC transporter substrate-binding protein n=1 Tax=Halomonas kashgarensis TaxID=3084920 RepID=UPI00321782D8